MTAAETIRGACIDLAALTFDDIPSATIERAKQVIADCVGVSIAGAREAPMAALLEGDRRSGIVRSSKSREVGSLASVWVGGRTDPAYAAFLNATAGSFLELDEGMRPTGHPGMHIVPAALAAAESERATGRELLRAVVIGYEISARTFRALRLKPGAHPHGHAGALGAAMAVGLIRGTNPVLGAAIAATVPLASTWQACYDGATARNTYMGQSAAVGVRSSDLARAGFSGSFAAFEVAAGTLLGDGLDVGQIGAEVDVATMAINDGYFKVHSACALTHTAIEAALVIQRSNELDLASIREIRVYTIAAGRKVDMQPPTNDLSSRFSLGYAVAAALLHGTSGPDAFTFDSRVAALAERVTVHVDDALDARWPAEAPARVCVVHHDDVIEAQVENPLGHRSRALDLGSLRTKFDGLIDDASVSERWWSRIMRIDECRHVEMWSEEQR